MAEIVLRRETWLVYRGVLWFRLTRDKRGVQWMVHGLLRSAPWK